MVDWNTGDLALCIDDDWAPYPPPEHSPTKGRAYIVLEVHQTSVGCYLRLSGFDSQLIWGAPYFVKHNEPPEVEKKRQSAPKTLEKV